MLPDNLDDIKAEDYVEVAALAQNLKALPKAYVKMSIEELSEKVSSYIDACTAVADDPINHPSHYTYGEIETIDYIEQVLGTEGLISFCIGNVLKYVSRCKHKGKCVEDLGKAKWYLNKAMDAFNKNLAKDTEW